MLNHFSDVDPSGIKYITDMITGPNPKAKVNFNVLGNLLKEMAERTRYMTLL